jgi:hypothetical protein
MTWLADLNLEGWMILLVGLSLVVWGGTGRGVPRVRDGRRISDLPPIVVTLIGMGGVFVGGLMLTLG